ncbi:MAG: hypothetical protein HOE90_09535 [Bacteriovoracaceae bacterium]|nr:hypothetical protein [Bacteriovoracaceae bacterium]
MRNLFSCTLFFIFLLNPVQCFSDQYLGDQLPEDYIDQLEKDVDSKEEDSAFIVEESEGLLDGAEVKEDYYSKSHVGTEQRNFSPKITNEDEVKSIEQKLPGEFADKDHYLKVSNKEIIDKATKIGNKNFSLMFYADDYTYKSKAGGFNTIFRAGGRSAYETSRSDIAPALKINYSRFLYRDKLYLGWGLGTGVGYNRGKGVFPGGELSDAYFYLWTIPLDIAAVAEVHFNSWVKFGAMAGPSVLGIIQHRTDLEKSDKRKSLTQMSPGFFFEGNMGFNLNKVLSRFGHLMLSDYDITKNYLTFGIRYQNYSNFKEAGSSVSGTSFGGGMTFEFF